MYVSKYGRNFSAVVHLRQTCQKKTIPNTNNQTRGKIYTRLCVCACMISMCVCFKRKIAKTKVVTNAFSISIKSRRLSEFISDAK